MMTKRMGRVLRGGTALVVVVVLSGCMGGEQAATPETVGRSAPVLDATMADGSESVLIEDLLNRLSVLEPGPLREVADAVMAANTRAAEADLRAAVLRSDAQSTNWLGAIGPAITLDALGAVALSVMVSQAILDGGARAAERAFARADVEVAAVSLAEDSNARVLEGVELYLRAQAALARAEVNRGAMETMGHYAWIMQERVAAGVTDRADLQLVTQRQDQMRADMAADMEEASTALAELAAMADVPPGLSGVSSVGVPQPGVTALNVMRARAEGARAIARAEATQAGYMPGIGVGGDLIQGGEDLTLSVGIPNGLTLGMGAAMQAAAAEAAAAEARIAQEQEAAARRIASLEGQRDSLIRQAGEADKIAADAAANYTLFEEQQRAGQRDVPEVVGVFETKVRSARAASDVRYDILMVEARIAAELGALVDGERI
jgi:adhesin transport system outer membrane protein